MSKSDDNTALRETLCELAKSLFDRGLTAGSTGNISARTPDGGLLVSPTGTCFGRLDPARLSLFDAGGRFVNGDKPTKEMPLHTAFYETRGDTAAVVHLHSCHAVALSLITPPESDTFLPPLTPYSIMQLGRVKLLPYFHPGDAAMGEAVLKLKGQHHAVMLANHGPVVAGKSVEAACNAIEELEATAKLSLLLKGVQGGQVPQPRELDERQINELVEKFDLKW